MATYESASIRRFNYGRVDVIRAATKEALAWTEAMTHNGRSKQEMLKLFQEAMAKQTDVMNKVSEANSYLIMPYIVPLRGVMIYLDFGVSAGNQRTRSRQLLHRTQRDRSANNGKSTGSF